MKPSQRDYKPPFGGSLRSEKNRKRRARLFAILIMSLVFGAWLYWRQQEIKKSQNFTAVEDSLKREFVSAALMKKTELKFNENAITQGQNLFHLRWSKDSSFFSLLCGSGERASCFEELSLLHPELPRAVMEQVAFLSPQFFWDSSSVLELDFQKLNQSSFTLAQVSFLNEKLGKPVRFYLQRDNTKAILDSNKLDTLILSGEFCSDKECKKFWNFSPLDNISQLILGLMGKDPENIRWSSQTPHDLRIINIKSPYFIPAVKSTLVDMEVLPSQKYSVILYCGHGNYLEIKNLQSLKEHLMLGHSLDINDTLGILNGEPERESFNIHLKWDQLGVNIPWDKNPIIEELIMEADSL